MRKIVFLFLFLILSFLSFSQKEIKISSIEINGNKVTKDAVILRELTFETETSLSRESLEKKMKESEENLSNLTLFNFAEIQSEIKDDKANIVVNVVERWYIWPYPIFELSERNFNVWWDEFKANNYSDFSRVNYGVFLVWENFRGRNELLKIKYRRGFKEHYLFNYEIPYFNKKKTLGLNAFTQLFRRKKSFYKTIDNKLLYYENGEQYTTKDFELELDVLYRKDTRHKHKLELHYYNTNIADFIKENNSNYLRNDKKNGDYFKATYQFANEQRDYITYPLHGHYLHFEITKNFAGSSPVNYLEVAGKAEKHLNPIKRLYIGSSFKAKVSSNGYQPYFAQEGLGYGDYVRTYEYYVIDGQHLWLSKTAIKYQLIGKRKFDLPYIKMPQFKKSHFSLYVSVFADIGYVIDKQNNTENLLANSLLFGKGISLDYVTYYDKLLRIEFGINGLGEKGIFLHFSNPFGDNKK